MSVTSFIPKVWSARILDNLEKTLVYAQLFNRDYEGEIQAYGDTVHIGSLGDVKIKKYTKNSTSITPDELATTDQLLVIDQADYFAFKLDDVDAAQTRADLIQKATASTAYGFGDETDKYLAGLLAKGTIKDKTKLGDDTTPKEITVANAYELLVNMSTLMTKANVPMAGRKVVVPPEFEAMMLLDDRFVKTGAAAAEERLANAVVARAAGFDIYVSNNVPNTSGNSKFKIIGATDSQGTYADQIVKTEAYRPEDNFSDAIKGLHVYGAKVLRPETIAVATVNFGVSLPA